jgi:hypothetical protein
MLFDLKLSNTLTKIGFVGEGGASLWGQNPVGVFDFNNNTGIVSQTSSTSGITTFFNSFQETIYGPPIQYDFDAISLEFSPNDTRLYVSSIYQFGSPGVYPSFNWLYKFHINTPGWNAPGAGIKIADYNNCIWNGVSKLALAPDGKIYVSRPGCNNLGVINNPDAFGTSSNFQQSSSALPFLSGLTSGSMMPNVVRGYFADVCPPPCGCTAWPSQINYGVNPTLNSANVTGSIANMSSIVLSQNSFISFPGIVAPCGNTANCHGNVSYELYDPSNSIIPAGTNGVNFSRVINMMPCTNTGIYKLVINAKCGAADCLIPFVIFISKPCSSSAMSICGITQCNTNVVNANSINISVNGGTPPFTYLWSNGSTNQNLTNVMPGQYTVTVMDANGYKATASFTLACLPSCNFLQKPNTIQTLNAGQTATIGGLPEPGITYSWFSNPVGFTSTVSNPTVSPTVNITYYLIRRNGNPGCPPKISTATVTVN